MTAFQNFRISTKIYVVVALLSAVAAVIGWMGIDAMRTYDAQVTAITRASDRAVLGERVNSLVLSVVMDSRGVYMSTSPAETEKFAKPLLGYLQQLKQQLAQWRALVPEAQLAQFAKVEANANQFIEFRTELVRLGRGTNAAAAREFGDNDANRSNRQALNNEIVTVADANNKMIADLSAKLRDDYDLRLHLLIGVAAFGILAALGLAVLISTRFISRPLSALTATMNALAGGDTTVGIPGAGRQDEVGHMSRAVQVFKDSMIEGNRLAAEQKAEQARKEQRQAAIEGYIEGFDESVSSSLDTLASASTELQATAQSMSKTAEETSRQSTAVAAASEEASTNVQTVASAAEELSASIVEISRQVAESSRISGQAVDDAGRTNAQVQALSQAAQKIGDVVKLISDIAGQTNLLALNATIEAARAGEAGKGFAVVASEVKSLANQTARATEEIGAQIKAIQGATEDSVQAIQGITGTISRINEIATTIAAAVEEQGAATKEIARNVQQASVGTNEVSSNIAGVTQAAGETGAASSQVLGASGELSKQGETLRAEVGRFLSNIRSA